jgi:hypothetical protein
MLDAVMHNSPGGASLQAPSQSCHSMYHIDFIVLNIINLIAVNFLDQPKSD